MADTKKHYRYIRNKIKNTCIKRYGVDYTLKSSVVRNKIINRLLPALPVLPLLLTILYAHKNCTTNQCI
jgi:hypothetical protein